MSNISKDYIKQQYELMHKKNTFSGQVIYAHLKEIKHIIAHYNITSLLDYGCAKGRAHKKEKLLDNVTLYDPYVKEYSIKPAGTFDMVICTDVMEHVPEDEVGKTLAELINYTDKVLFLSICTKKANKTFANGNNLHITIKPKEWWEEMLSCAKNITIVRHYT